MTKIKKMIKETDNSSSVFNKLERYKLKCSICPPNAGENWKRKGKHGKTKAKYKDKRK